MLPLDSVPPRNDGEGETTVSPNSSLRALEEGVAIQDPSHKSVRESSFEEFVEWVSNEREGLLHGHLVHDVHLVDFSPPTLKVRLSPKAPKDLPQRLQILLKTKKNEAWTIAISDEIGHPTLQEKEQKVQEERREAVLQDPLVKTLMEAFPGTTLMSIEDA